MNALSTISGQFGKGFVLGTLLPTLVYVLLFFLLVLPLAPGHNVQLDRMSGIDALTGIVPVSLASLIVSGILFNLNIPVIRFYEGYPWSDSWIGKWRVNNKRDKLRRLQQAESRLEALLASHGLSDDMRITLVDRRTRVAQMQSQFPSDSNLVLPTRLGNVIRAFELYPTVQYGMDSIALWPRLMAKIDKDYAIVISDAKTSFDFMLNCSFLGAIMLGGLLTFGMLFPTVAVSAQILLPWLLEIATFALAAYVFYIGAIGSAGGWGEVVKSAFDLYRLDLLRQLGYARAPGSLAEERPIWADISQQLLYGPSGLQPVYAPYPTVVSCEPCTVALQLTRGIEVITDDLIRVVVEARNNSERRVRSVTVTDTLTAGMHYRWNSARASGRRPQVHVEGVNPYRFTLPGALKPGGTAVLMYEAIVRKA